MRFTENVGEDTYIKFMTDGILLAEIQSDRWLSRYDTLIIDEAHERSLNIDFLLGYLQQLLRKRRDLKLIITSATIDTERFARHFGDAPVINVEGRSYPVEVRYRPPEGEGEQVVDGRTQDARGGERTHERRHRGRGRRDHPRRSRSGDVLVFLPGEREIRDAHRALAQRKYRRTEVLALYARLSARDQDRVFQPGPAAAHRADHQCRRNLADGAAHPLRGRSRRGARQALFAAAEARPPAHRADLAGQRRPAQGPLRARRRPASAIACTRKPISCRGRAIPIRKSCAPRSAA